jgi:hypothetical protein
MMAAEQAEIAYDGPGAPIWAAAGAMQKIEQAARDCCKPDHTHADAGLTGSFTATLRIDADSTTHADCRRDQRVAQG